MDAYDIFKKLTKGLTFKHKVLGVKNNELNNNNSVTIKSDLKIKQEPVNNEENDHIEADSASDNDSGPQSESEDQGEETGDENQDITLMEGVKIGEKKKKTKKVRSEDLQKKLQLEEHNRFRNEHGIKTVGRHVPAALADFADLTSRFNVSQGLVDTVTQCGYCEPTPVQRQATPCMLEDRQILACAPTGSGKTAAFLIPILHSLGAPQGGPRALVLCPTRELAHQIYREALRLSSSTELRCNVVRNMKESKIKEREATIRKSDIVISTPNRICYLLNGDKVNISLDKVRWLIIDEADKLFEGSVEEQSAFRQQMEQIMSTCGHPQRRIAMFSATHTPAVAKWCRHNMRGLINITVGQRNAATSLVEQELLYCGNENGKLVAFRQLVQKGLKPPVLVFVQSKDRAKQLFKELIYDGINVDVIHADRTQAQRDNVVRSFRTGRIWVLICTELLGRGIDFRGVNLVLNYDFPPSAIAYIHRVGRAGRAGQKGRAITFCTEDDVTNLRSIASVMKQSGCEVPEYMLRLKQDNNKRRKLMQRAPRRDNISTILDRKRKLDSKDPKETGAIKDAKTVNSGKNNKNRKIEKDYKNNRPNKNEKKTNGKISKNFNKEDNFKKKSFKKESNFKNQKKHLNNKKTNKKNIVHKKAKNVKSKLGKK